MIWKEDFKRIYIQVRKKIGSASESAFDKQLQRKSNKLGLASSQAALVILAAENDVGYRTEFQKLSETQQSSVAQIIQNLNGGTREANSIETTRTKKRSIKPPLEIGNDFADPYVSDSLYRGIHHEGYSIMFVLENSIRFFITRVLSHAHGTNWWDQIKKKKSLKDTVDKVDFRKATDSQNWYHSKRGAHEIFYTDYSELLQIIRVFNSDFNKYFKRGAEKNLIEKLSELAPSRNVIAHNNPITKNDLERLKVHAKDWFKYMQYLHEQNN